METLISFVTACEDKFADGFGTLFSSIHAWAKAILVFGLFLHFLYSWGISNASGQRTFPLDKLAEMLIICVVFSGLSAFIKPIDQFLQIPTKEAKIALGNSASKELDKFKDHFQTTYAQVTSADSTSESKNDDGWKIDIVKGMKKTMVLGIVNIYILIVSIIYVLMIISMLLIIVLSSFGANVMIALSPVTVAVSVLPGFGSSIASFLKNLIAIRLWGAVAGAFATLMFNENIVGKLTEGMVKNLENISQGKDIVFSEVFDILPLAVMLIAIACIAKIPSFVDMVLSSSAGTSAGSMLGATNLISKAGSIASGGAKSVISGATGAVGSVAKGGLNTAKSVGRGALGKAGTFVKEADKASGSKGAALIKNTKSAIENANPLSDKNVKSAGKKVGESLSKLFSPKNTKNTKKTKNTNQSNKSDRKTNPNANAKSTQKPTPKPNTKAKSRPNRTKRKPNSNNKKT